MWISKLEITATSNGRFGRREGLIDDPVKKINRGTLSWKLCLTCKNATKPSKSSEITQCL